MAKPKGSKKIGGRAKGTPNKKTVETIEFIKKILDSQQEQIEKDLKTVEPAKRLDFYGKLIEYVIPKKRNMDIDIKTDKPIEIKINDFREKKD